MVGIKRNYRQWASSRWWRLDLHRTRPKREDFTALAGERGQWRDKLRRGWVQPVEVRNPQKYLHSSRSKRDE